MYSDEFADILWSLENSNRTLSKLNRWKRDIIILIFRRIY